MGPVHGHDRAALGDRVRRRGRRPELAGRQRRAPRRGDGGSDGRDLAQRRPRGHHRRRGGPDHLPRSSLGCAERRLRRRDRSSSGGLATAAGGTVQTPAGATRRAPRRRPRPPAPAPVARRPRASSGGGGISPIVWIILLAIGLWLIYAWWQRRRADRRTAEERDKQTGQLATEANRLLIETDDAPARRAQRAGVRRGPVHAGRGGAVPDRDRRRRQPSSPPPSRSASSSTTRSPRTSRRRTDARRDRRAVRRAQGADR